MTKHCSRGGLAPRSRWFGATLFAAGLALLPLAALAAPTISGLNSAQGTLGSYVLIYGSGFGNSQGQSYVMVGQHFIPVVSWSDSAITAYLAPTSMVMGPGEVPALVVVQQPGNNVSNGYMLGYAGTGSTMTPPSAVSGTSGGTSPGTTTGQTPTTSTGTTTPAAGTGTTTTTPTTGTGTT